MHNLTGFSEVFKCHTFESLSQIDATCISCLTILSIVTR